MIFQDCKNKYMLQDKSFGLVGDTLSHKDRKE